MTEIQSAIFAPGFQQRLGVHEQQELDLMSAIRKMSLMPAERLQTMVPMMARKGRVQVGCDADLTLFDPQTVGEQATYEHAFLPSHGIPWVLVAGTPVVRAGKLVEEALPGQAIRSDVK